MKNKALFIIGLAIVLGYIFWKYQPLLTSPTPLSGPTELTIWTLDEEKLYQGIVEDYLKQNPKQKIHLVNQNALNYRTRVQTKIRAGNGPDIFWLHNSWVPMFLVDLNPAPATTLSVNEFSQLFYPLAKETLTSKDSVYAIPTETDGLALFYNEDIIKGVGANVPTTWRELTAIAKQVTVRNQKGEIQTAGIALGSTTNVDFWPDIIGLLFSQQNKANLAAPATVEGAEVLTFYTSFITDPQNKTWDVTLPPSSQMFADGKLAFYLAPVAQVGIIKTANPGLNFKVSPVPQLLGRNITWGSFGALGVSFTSLHQKEAWQFLKYLTSASVQQKLYSQRIQFGLPLKPYARVDLAQSLTDDPQLGAFVKQAPFYKGWYLNYKTLDAGLNEEMINLYERAINSVLQQGQDPLTALQLIQPKVKEVLDKYTQKPELSR